MTRRAPHIPQRRRIFVGCEGQSELGYGILLARIARELPDVHVHIDARVLQPGAGDPFALVTRAAQVIATNEERREPYAIKAVLLDIGPAQINAAAMTAAMTAATRHGIQHLIWQSPDHEALLLRHLPGCQQRRPPRGASLAALRGEWADYKKGSSAQQLAGRIAFWGAYGKLAWLKPSYGPFWPRSGSCEHAIRDDRVWLAKVGETRGCLPRG